MSLTRRAVLALAAAVSLAACTEDPFAPDLAPQGEARFTYTGELSGEFVASGRLNRRNPNAGAWAAGELQDFEDSQILGVFGQVRRPDLKIDGFILEWEGAKVGTVTCAPPTPTTPAPECPFSAVFAVGTERFTGTAEAQYSRATGTMTVTELTEDRARGTFNLTLLRQVTGEEPPSIQASGSFDVPLNVID